MNIHSRIKKGTKKIGNAFGVSDIQRDIVEIKEEISNLKNASVHLDHFNKNVDDWYLYAYPFVRFYYYNEFAKNLHPLVFEKYRDCNAGKKVVIVACGPSVDRYEPIAGAKHLAINRAFLRKDIKFDYIFMHDSAMIDNHRDALKKYKADKFIAFATSANNAKLFNSRSEDVVDIGARRFLISDAGMPDINGGQFDVIQPDITKGLLYDRGGGTVFSALQFALFTGPKEIYLVGCDCSSDGYFNDINGYVEQKLLEKTEYLWHEAKAFVDQYYPNTKIISVNPVALKGLFKDLNQK